MAVPAWLSSEKSNKRAGFLWANLLCEDRSANGKDKGSEVKKLDDFVVSLLGECDLIRSYFLVRFQLCVIIAPLSSGSTCRTCPYTHTHFDGISEQLQKGGGADPATEVIEQSEGYA